MPNVGKKHHIEPKRLTQKAYEFYLPYSNSVEDINKAISNATRFEEVSKNAANSTEDKARKKTSLNVSNFWCEVKHHLMNYKKKLKDRK